MVRAFCQADGTGYSKVLYVMGRHRQAKFEPSRMWPDGARRAELQRAVAGSLRQRMLVAKPAPRQRQLQCAFDRGQVCAASLPFGWINLPITDLRVVVSDLQWAQDGIEAVSLRSARISGNDTLCGDRAWLATVLLTPAFRSAPAVATDFPCGWIANLVRRTDARRHSGWWLSKLCDLWQTRYPCSVDRNSDG